MIPPVPEDAKPTVIKSNVLLITFFARTWMLMIFMVASNWIVLWKHEFFPKIVNGNWQGLTLFEMLGAVLFIPALGSAVFWFYLLMLHLFFRDTLDKDAHDGVYIADWRAMSSFERMQINAWLRIGFFIGFCILFASLARGAVPDQEARWKASKINPHYSIALDLAVAQFKRDAARYQEITDMRVNGVPPQIIFALHGRESSWNWRRHPHEGSPLTGRTRFVPKGRLLAPQNPPYTFKQSAGDAYYDYDHLDRVNWKSCQEALQGIERFNGLGYQLYHQEVPSPYVYNGLLINGKATVGKYSSDGRFDRTMVDAQLGVAAILMRMRELGIKAPWD